MTKTRSICFSIASVTIMLSMALASSVHAASISLDITKSKDANVKVFNTILGIPIPGSIIDVDLPAGTQLKTTVNSDFPLATGVRLQQKFIDPVRVGQVTTGSIAFIIPDSANPGQFTMPLLASYLEDQVGLDNRVPLPDLASSFFDVFVSIDLRTWINAGSPQPLPLDSILEIFNGISPNLPGIQVGLSEITFDPGIGWVNPTPFSGNVFVLGNLGIAAAPEPSILILVGLALALLIVTRCRNNAANLS